MILVTIGTQDKKFPRLLEAVQKQIDLGNIKDKVIVQAGQTEFKSDDMEIFDFLPMDEFDKLMDNCDLLITHAGIGSIINGLKKGKKVIVAARLQKYDEHENDHQLQIANSFDKEGYVIHLNDFDKLGDVIKNIDNFNPRKFKSNTSNFCNKLKDYIDNN